MPVSLPLFDRFPEEGRLIGRILSAYGELEYEFCYCVATILQNQDLAVKVMFRTRGESQRIAIGDAIGSPGFHRLSLGTKFEDAVRGIRHSVKIRNQYAHCLWTEPEEGKIAFVDLEEIAKSNAAIDFSALTQHHVTQQLLKDQLAYLSFIEDCFIYLRFEAQVQLGLISEHKFHVPANAPQPSRYFP